MRYAPLEPLVQAYVRAVSLTVRRVGWSHRAVRACGALELTANASWRDVSGKKVLFGALMHVRRTCRVSQNIEWLSVLGAGSTPSSTRARCEAALTATRA